MISIIIPTLNEEKFLPALLDSLVTQTIKDFEVLVVDGGSKDKTVEKARSFQKRLRLKVIQFERGVSKQRNKGANEAVGDWLVFIDADSVVMPYFIDRILLYITQNTPLVFTTWAQPDSPKGDDAIFTLFFNIFLEGALLFKRPIAPGPLTIIRSEIFHTIGGYNESQAFDEDMDLGLRLAKKGIIIKILHESLYVWSMRRIRHEGKIKLMNQYIISAIPILLFKRTFTYMPGYNTGGHLYDKKRKPMRPFVFKQFEKKFKSLMKEFLE